MVQGVDDVEFPVGVERQTRGTVELCRTVTWFAEATDKAVLCVENTDTVGALVSEI